MAYVWTGQVADSGNAIWNINITDDLYCTKDREYVTDFKWDSYATWYNSYAGDIRSTGAQYSTSDINEYTAICQRQDGYFYTHKGGNNSSVRYTVESNRPTEYANNTIIFPQRAGWGNDGTIEAFTIATNIPIFLYEDRAYYDIYTSTSRTLEERNDAITHAINYSTGDTVPETKEYFYYGYAHNYTVDEFGGVSENNEPVLYKGFRVKSTGRVSLYVIDGIENGHLKLGINLADVEIAYYSYDGVTWQNQQSSPTTLPFDFVWRKWNREKGTFYCSGIDGKLYETNCYIFGNKDDSDDYNDGTDETGEKAINYGDVNPDSPFNPTGLEDDETTFGEVYTRAFFSQQYICSDTDIQEISNAMFDTTQGGITGIFDDIKKGLEMYGEGGGVINAVQSCMF